MKDNSGYPNMPGAVSHLGAVGPAGPTGIGEPPSQYQYFCPKHGRCEPYYSWTTAYCRSCLAELAASRPGTPLLWLMKLLDPIIPWTDRLTKEDFAEED